MTSSWLRSCLLGVGGFDCCKWILNWNHDKSSAFAERKQIERNSLVRFKLFVNSLAIILSAAVTRFSAPQLIVRKKEVKSPDAWNRNEFEVNRSFQACRYLPATAKSRISLNTFQNTAFHSVNSCLTWCFDKIFFLLCRNEFSAVCKFTNSSFIQCDKTCEKWTSNGSVFQRNIMLINNTQENIKFNASPFRRTQNFTSFSLFTRGKWEPPSIAHFSLPLFSTPCVT